MWLFFQGQSGQETLEQLRTELRYIDGGAAPRIVRLWLREPGGGRRVWHARDAPRGKYGSGVRWQPAVAWSPALEVEVRPAPLPGLVVGLGWQDAADDALLLGRVSSSHFCTLPIEGYGQVYGQVTGKLRAVCGQVTGELLACSLLASCRHTLLKHTRRCKKELLASYWQVTGTLRASYGQVTGKLRAGATSKVQKKGMTRPPGARAIRPPLRAGDGRARSSAEAVRDGGAPRPPIVHRHALALVPRRGAEHGGERGVARREVPRRGAEGARPPVAQQGSVALRDGVVRAGAVCE